MIRVAFTLLTFTLLTLALASCAPALPVGRVASTSVWPHGHHHRCATAWTRQLCSPASYNGLHALATGETPPSGKWRHLTDDEWQVWRERGTVRDLNPAWRAGVTVYYDGAVQWDYDAPLEHVR